MQWLNDLKESSAKLGKFASRFEMAQHQLVANDLTDELDSIKADATSLDEQKKEKINKVISALSECTQRKSDSNDSAHHVLFFEPLFTSPLTIKRTLNESSNNLSFLAFVHSVLIPGKTSSKQLSMINPKRSLLMSISPARNIPVSKPSNRYNQIMKCPSRLFIPAKKKII